MKKQTWIDWFLSQPENQLFVKIDDEYLQNTYNFYGIKQKISSFQASYELIQKNYVPPWHARTKLESQVFVLEQQTSHLYGLLHARYLLTAEGMEKMYQKYIRGEFPHCPRVLCRKISCLPYGISYNMCEYPVKMFCPNCNDIYNFKNPVFSKIDGSFFGNSWIPLFLKKYNYIIPSEKAKIHVPKIFGFDILLGTDSDSDTKEKEEDSNDSNNNKKDNSVENNNNNDDDNSVNDDHHDSSSKNAK